MRISFIGAGNVAQNLGNLFSKAGHEVFLGSRNPKQQELHIKDAIEKGDIICFAVPFSAVKDICIMYKDEFNGKLIIDITNPINSNDWSPIDLNGKSGAEEIAKWLPSSTIVKAFNAIFADVMTASKKTFEGVPLTAFIASDNEDALEITEQLANTIGFAPLLIQGLKNARYLEAIAHLNITIALAGGGTDAGFVYHKR